MCVLTHTHNNNNNNVVIAVVVVLRRRLGRRKRMKYFFKEQSTKNVMAAKLMILSFQEETHRFNSDLTQDLSECLKRSKQ